MGHSTHNVDMLDTLLVWGTDNPLQAALIHTHLEDHEFDEIPQDTDNPLQATLIHTHLEYHEFDEIPQVVFPMQGPNKIPHKVKFLKDEGNRCFKNNEFVNTSSYYLDGIKFLCFSCIISDDDETLFKHLAVSLNLNLAHEVCDVEKPGSYTNKQFTTSSDSEASNVTINLDAMSIVTGVNKDFVRDDNSTMEADRASICSCLASTSLISVEDRKNIDSITSSVSHSMDVDHSIDKQDMFIAISSNISTGEKKIIQWKEIEFYNSRSMTYMVVRARPMDSNSLAYQH
ncbi:hypothetical protein Cgig2_026581 [Carnegiea gigantea]|uniref:Uncharacterized protein n=1 Tax=Carnegiea gigantea TaxID=171969 RepID=A0A9Q1KKJ8_9CARY|nr:hypothetical protein Cgig2_026581 [Carnegiea gigantea]